MSGSGVTECKADCRVGYVQLCGNSSPGVTRPVTAEGGFYRLACALRARTGIHPQRLERIVEVVEVIL